MDDHGSTEKTRCKGKTAKGAQCKHKVFGDFCQHHADQAPGAEVEDGLNRQQRLFVEFYFANGFNQTKAALDAGYSPKCAGSIASNLMANPKIKAVVEARLETYAMSANETLARLSEFGRGTIAHFVDDEGNLDLTSPEAQAHRHLIEKINYDKYGRPESVKILDPKDAVKSLVKVHGLAVDRVEHSGSVEHRQAPEYDLSVLTDEELEQLEAITRKLEAAAEAAADSD